MEMLFFFQGTEANCSVREKGAERGQYNYHKRKNQSMHLCQIWFISIITCYMSRATVYKLRVTCSGKAIRFDHIR
jgi:hypothetical protein